MPGRIFIESKPIALGQRHLYLVFQNNEGQEFVIRGGAEREDAQGMLEGELNNHGSILTEAGTPMEKSRDYRNGDTFNRSRLDITDKLQGRDPETVWRSWEAMSQRIGDSHTEYHLKGPNSNSTVASILASESIDINDVRPGSFENYPGVEADKFKILAPYEMPAHIMPGTSPVYDSNTSLPWVNDTQSTITLQPMSYQSEQPAESSSLFPGLGNLMSTVTDFFSHAFDLITGNTPRQQAKAMMANDNFYRQMGLNPASLEKLLENGMESLMGKITEHLTRGGNVGSLALGRTLAQHPTMLADIMRASRRNELGGAFEDVLFGKNGNSGLVGDAITNAVMSGINRTLGVGKMRSRTSSAESERSRETARNWNYSRGQQQAMVAAWVAAGKRNW